MSSSNHQFSGDMLVFREVYNCLELLPRQNHLKMYHPTNEWKWLKMMKFTSQYPHSQQIYFVDSFPMFFVQSHPLFFTSKCSFLLHPKRRSTKTPQPSHLPPAISPSHLHPQTPTQTTALPRRGELLKNPSPANIPIDPLAPSERVPCGHGRSIPLFEHTPGIPKNFP